MRVSPEFEDLLNRIEDDFKKKYKTSPSKPNLTKYIADQLKQRPSVINDKDDRRTDFI